MLPPPRHRHQWSRPRISYTKGVPGGVIVQTFKATAIVTAIDQAKRQAKLLGPDGNKFTVEVGAGSR